MTKIKKLHHKRLNFPPENIRELRVKLEAADVGEIHNVLEPYQEWPFVRGDMYHWIAVLNRFDDVMGEVCEKYGLAELQKVDFDGDTQRTLVAILHFSRLLLENCINRNLYSSVDRLDCLLNTSDPMVLESTLRLLLRTSQRWSYQRDLKANQAMMSSRLMTLADPWHAKKDVAPFSGEGSAEAALSHTNEFKLLAQDENTDLLKAHGGIIHYQFFRTADDVQQLADDSGTGSTLDDTSQPAGVSAATAAPDTRRRAGEGTGSIQRRTSSKKSLSQIQRSGSGAAVAEGLVSIRAPIGELDLDSAATLGDQMRQALGKLVSKYKVPSAHHYELRHRIYVALAFATGNSELRYVLLRSRIFAAAVLSQLMNEQEFKNMFLSREPNFTSDIIGVLQPDVHAPLGVQTAVFLALESLLKQRSEVSGAYVALNASANHGVLMFILRKAFMHTDGPPVYPYEFMSALYFFLTGMANNMNGGQLLVSAGVVPIFVAALRNTHPEQRRGVGRVAKLLDYLISSTSSTFPAFCSANGIAALVDRMRTEVDSAVQQSRAAPPSADDLTSPVTLPHYPDYPKQLYRRREVLQPEHIYLLKELFKLLSHLVQQSNYQDRLRNLVETTLPVTLRTVLENPVAFGNNIYGLAISISAMLVHNEPTSLPIIQEVHLPDAMLANLEKHIPYNSDVIMSIPGALGAFCLNDAGMEQFRASKIMRKVLATFSDPDFIRVLQEGDVTGSFGSSLDEFMRHFPVVKDGIMDEIIVMLKDVQAMGDVNSPLLKLNPGSTFLLRSAKEEDIKAYLDDFYGMMLESVTTFLEGLLEQRAHGEMFMDRGGWDLVVQTIRSPLLPFGFVKSRTFESLHGLSSALLDTSQEGVFKALFKELRESMHRPMISGCASQDDPSAIDVAGYLALADPASLSPESFDLVHTKLHNTVSATGAIALVTYLVNGSGGGSLTRCVKEVSDIMSADDFVALVKSVCSAFCNSVEKAVAIEYVIATLPEPSDAKKAEQATSAKGKSPERATPDQQAMDVDDSGSSAIEPYVNTNYTNLGEVAIAFSLEAGDFIECMSNSLGLGVKTDEGTSAKIAAPLASVLVGFLQRLLDMSQHTEHTAAGAQLVDQAMVAIMRTLVYARHRTYIKLRVFNLFVEERGVEKFCAVLEMMWEWAASLPPATTEPDATAKAASDPAVRLRKILDATLESMISILSFILDGEPIMECPEYASLCRDHDARRGWFRPGDFIVDLRLKALPTLQRIWNSPLLIHGNSYLIRAFIACLGPILSAQHETRTASSRVSIRRHLPSLMEERYGSHSSRRGSGTHTPIPLLARALGAVERSSPLSRTLHQYTSAADMTPNPSYVSELERMGFSVEDSEAALRRQSNNLARAADELLGSVLANRNRTGDRNAGNASSGDAQAESSGAAASGGAPEGESSGQQDVPSEGQEPAESASTATNQAQGSGSATDDPQPAQQQDEQSQEQDTEPMAVDSGDQSARDSGGDAEQAPENADTSTGESGEGRPPSSSTEPAGVEPFNVSSWRATKEAEEDERRKQLQKLRDELRESIAPRAISLVDEFKDKAVSQVRGVLELVLRKGDAGPVVHVLLNAFTPLLDSAMVPENDSGTEERLAAHVHLWAVLLCTSTLMDRMYPYIGKLSQYLVRAVEAASQRAENAPEWLAALLLVVELLLQRDSQPPRTKLEDTATLNQIAKRRLTKLPPSSAPLDESAAGAADTSNPAPANRPLEALSSSRPGGSAFELIFPEEEESGDAADNGDDKGDDDDDEPKAEGSAGPMFDTAEKQQLQALATRFFLVPLSTFKPAVVNALLRLVVVLTRNPEFAAEFLNSGGLANAVRAMRSLSHVPNTTTSITQAMSKEKTPLSFVNEIMSVPKDQQKELRQERTLVVHVLRHVIECQPVLRLLMENLIQGWFESPQFSSPDANTFVRATLAYALRDAELYKQVATERCFLPSYNDEMRTSWMTLAWRSTKLLDEEEVDRFENMATDPSADGSGSDTNDAPEASSEPPKPSSGFLEYLDQKKKEPPFEPYRLDAESEKVACRIVEFIVEEILALRPFGGGLAISRTATTTELQMPSTPSKPQQRSSSYAALATAASAAQPTPALAAAGSSTDDSPEITAYRCFLLQSLSELLASFPFALRAIFAARTGPQGIFSPRKDKGKSKAPAGQDDGAGQAPPPPPQQQQQQQQQALRVRSPLVSHLVHDLVVREAATSTRAPKPKSKAEEVPEGTELEQIIALAQNQISVKRAHLSRSTTFWATALLSTICVRHQEGWSTTATTTDSEASGDISLSSLVGNYDRSLSAARQLTLDHIVRAFRECLSATAAGNGSSRIIYARLTSLAHLAYKLVIARPISHGRASDGRNAQQTTRESPNALKKMLLERGVLDLLTAAASRLNLNHPLSRDMLNLFLRPMEHLAKAAVKISREAVLKAWEESGQEKMPLAAGQRSFNMDLLDDEAALIDEDEDIPPDLYQNSALGLHQNQRVASRTAGGDHYDEDDMMEEDFEEDLYDDDGSSVSDIDTEDEVMEDDIMLDDTDIVADGDGDAMEMDTIMHEGQEELSDDSDDSHSSRVGSAHDDSSDSDGSSDDSGDEVRDIGGAFRFALDNAMNLLQDDEDHALHDEEERILRAEEADADYYSSDLDGEEVRSSDGEGAAARRGQDQEHEDGWDSELSDANIGPHSALHHQIARRFAHSRVAGRSRPPSIADEPTGLADVGSRSSSRIAGGDAGGGGVGPGSGADIAAVAAAEPLTSSEGDSDESSDEMDPFIDDFPDTLEITMEAIDGHGPSEDIRGTDLSNFVLDTIAASLGEGRLGGGIRTGLRPNGIPSLMHGRPLGAMNGFSADGGGGNGTGRDMLVDRDHDTMRLNYPPRLLGMGRPGLLIGSGVGPAGHSMVHPLLDRGERQERSERGGMQARAERVARSTMNGPLRGTPDDVYELGQSLAMRLSSALSSGRRPAYTHRLVPGPSNRTGGSPWTQESSGPEQTGLDSSIEGAMGDSSSQVVGLLEQLIHMSWAVSAIECYMPLSTIERWQEEAHMQFGSNSSEYSWRIAYGILNVLIPEAICQNLLRSRYQVEVMRRTAISDRKRMEQEDEERRQREEEARQAEEARLREEDANKAQQLSEGGSTEPDSSMAIDADDASSHASGEDADQAEAEAEAEAEPPEPVFVTVDGEQIDITDTGIDLEFLLALPDDLRMEVIDNRRDELRAERRGEGAGSAAADTSARQDTPDEFIQEFLDALPPEIREEVLESGPLQRQLLEQEGLLQHQTGGGTASAQREQHEHANRADPQMSGLEAAVRDRVRVGVPRGGASRLLQSMSSTTEQQTEQNQVREKRRKKIASRDIAVQLLSGSELIALTKFIFLPNHALSSPLILKIVQFICENNRTRSMFIHLVLSILDSNATSLHDVDAVIRKALAASQPAEPTTAGSQEGPTMPLSAPLATETECRTPQRNAARAGGLPTQQTADQPTSAVLGTPAVSQFTTMLVQQQNPQFSFPLGDLQSDVPAYVPAQRCLETLHSLAAHNPRAAMHFLVEHHGLKAHASEAGIETDGEESRFPVVHLLRLLEKPLYYSHGSAITELLMQLLSTVTKPLGSMVRRNQQAQSEQQPSADADKSRFVVQLPGIPGNALRAIVNVVAAGECTSRTFQHTLSLIQNLSHMPGVLPIITDELIGRATELSEGVCGDISQLLDVLKTLPPPAELKGDEDTAAEDASSGVKTPSLASISQELLDKVRDITLARFSPASSHQSRLLRLLMAIDYISTTVAKRLEEKQKATSAETQQGAEGSGSMDVDASNTPSSEESLAAELVHLRSLSLSRDTQFLPLWESTGQCLQYTSAHTELAHVATVLLPLIESFMVVFKPIVGETNKAVGATEPSTASTADFGEANSVTSAVPSSETYFRNFTEKHKKVLNTLVRNNPGLLSGSFSLLVYNPHVLDFDNKRSYFYQRLHDDTSAASNQRGGRTRLLGSMLQVSVRRPTVFEDSYHQFAGKSGDEIKRGRINVKFHDEEGVDAGGVSREWFQALARQMFNPDYALFKPSASGRVTYQPNPQSWANPEHLLYFKFVGRIIGKAIVDQRVLDAYFTRSFYKHILSRKVDYRDMEAIDPSYYKSLEWILENDITDLFEETFSIEVDNFGEHRIIDLIPDGHNVLVTEENKAEYVRLVTEQRLYLAIKDQINAFLTGFHDIIPKDLVQIFNEQELELLISGMPDVDVDDWRNNTEYHGGYNSTSAQIQWFWRAVRSFDQEERAKLLQFVTGTSKVPLEGFAHLQGNQGVQKFQIHKDFASSTRLPTAHTCFNQLDLPLYDRFETLKANLLLAISECSTGFGFV